MKAIKYITGTVLSTLFLCSCSNFLEREPIDFYTPEDISTQNDILQAVNGAYRMLIYKPGDRLQPLSHDFMADDGFCNDMNYGELLVWKGDQTPDDDKCIKDKWERDYAGILRANTVLYYAPTIVGLDETLCKRYMAEAKFLRAYFYADLIEIYGDVPYRTETEGLKKKISPRVDKETILYNILLDLDEAAKDLPEEYDAVDYGRATKGAAYALKARICLYNHLYDWCIDACRNVIALNLYDLHPSYKELFTVAVEKTNKEYIFTQQFIQGKNSEGLSGIFWTKLSAYSAYQISHNLVEEFYMKSTGLRYDVEGSGYSKFAPYSDRDPRLLYNIKIEQGDMTGKNHTGYKAQKFVDDAANPSGIHRDDEIDYPLIRYADVLLMLAEALVESGSYDYDEVVGLVDRIRQRGDVMMPTIGQVEGKDGPLSQDELRQVIRHERRVEFPLEGLRYSDIRRWEIGPEALTDCYAVVKITDNSDPENPSTYYDKTVFMKRTFNTAKGYLWPIPAIEIQTNPMVNNPGYVGGPQ